MGKGKGRGGSRDAEAGGFGAAIMGADDPRATPPSFSAMMVAIFASVVSIAVLAGACTTNSKCPLSDVFSF